MRLLPILKPAEWEGLAHGARAHLWLGTPDFPLVFVGYAWENGDELTYVTRQGSEHDETDDLIGQAFDNLEAYDTPFETVETNGARLLVSAGRPFAAERVMSEGFMLGVHAELGSDRVVVSIPKRGSMLASAWDSPREARTTIVSLHLEAWRSAGHSEYITDHLIVFEMGLLAGTLSVTADGVVEGWS